MDKYEFKYIYNKSVHKFSGNTVNEILFRVANFLTSRGEVADLERMKALIENQLRTVSQPKKKKPKLSEAYHAGMALFRLAKGETVDQKTVDERTKICSNCPMRSPTSFCGACGGLSLASNLLISIRRLVKNSLMIDSSIKADFCDVCGCSLPLLIVTNTDLLPKDDPAEDKVRPQHCWIRK